MRQICEDQPLTGYSEPDGYGKPVLRLDPPAIYGFAHLIRLTPQLLTVETLGTVNAIVQYVAAHARPVA